MNVDLFDYLAVLVSIVIGLGMSELISAWGRLIRERERVRFYWLHTYWSVFVLLLMVQMWWGFWNFRDMVHWTFGGLLIVVGETLVLVLAVQMLTPTRRDDGQIDLREHFHDNIKWFYLLIAVLLGVMSIADIVMIEQDAADIENAIRLIGALMALAAMWFKKNFLHAIFSIIAGVMFIGFVALEFTR